jgi:hypothetical protein
MAALAVLAAAAAFATPAPPGTYRCEPAIHHLPCTRGMVRGSRYRYDLDTSCGVIDAWFDGRRWLATPKLSDGSGNPPPGWSTPWQRGTITLVTRSRALFRAGTLSALFRPARSTETAECNPPPSAPPPATVATAAEVTRLAWGSYCWSGERSAMCVDMLPPELRTDIPRLQVDPGATLTFELGFLPTAAGLTLTGAGRTPLLDVRLAAARTISWQVPTGFATPGADVLATLFLRAPNGDASYLVWLHA